MTHRAQGRARHVRVVLAGSVLGIALTATGVSAAPTMGAEPPSGSTGFAWKKASCEMNPNTGVMVKIGSIRTEVRSVADASPGAGENTRYYQLVKVQIDRYTSAGWRKVQLKKWDWGRFTIAQLPTHSTSAVRTGMGHDAGYFSAKATVRLKRVIPGPDYTVWKYTTRSRSFQCGFGAPGEALPSPGGS